MTVTTNAPWLAPGRSGPKRRGPRLMMWLGTVLSVVGWGGFILGFVLMATNMFEAVDEGIDPESKLDLSVAVPGEGSVDLDRGRYQVVALGSSLTAVSGQSSDAGGLDVNRLPFAEPPVSVTGPDGALIALEPPGTERLTHTPGLDAVGILEFSVAADGRYTLAVGGEPSAVTRVGIGEATTLWEEASPWLKSSAVIAVGALLGGLGLMLIAGGIIGSIFGRVRSGMTQPFR